MSLYIYLSAWIVAQYYTNGVFAKTYDCQKMKLTFENVNIEVLLNNCSYPGKCFKGYAPRKETVWSRVVCG